MKEERLWQSGVEPPHSKEPKADPPQKLRKDGAPEKAVESDEWPQKSDCKLVEAGSFASPAEAGKLRMTN